MAKVVFTAHLKQVGPTDVQEVDGATIADVLTSVFENFPALKGYILDDQDRVRKHIAIFVDGTRIENENAPKTTVEPQTELYILQALSGG